MRISARTLTSALIMMSVCIATSAQKNNMDSLLQRLQELGKQTGIKVERIEKTHEYVDLGLSVKWATCNVGADKPQEFGNLYAWGETQPASEGSIEKYKFCKGDNKSFTKYCSDKNYGYKRFTDNKTTLDPDDDVAHVKWGADWRMPTIEECQELIDKCTWTCDSINGVNGYRVTSNVPGYTDRSIFLPAAGGDGGYTINGRSFSNTLNYRTKGGFFTGNFWSSTLDSDNPQNAGSLAFFTVGAILPGVTSVSINKSSNREFCKSVRPVHQ